MRTSLAIAALLFACAVASGLHGYSLPAWHRVLDGSPEDEIVAGESRRIRGDDWFVQIPLALAQRAVDPPFPRVNPLIGIGQDVILPVAVPVLHPIALLRPATWGFFAGADLGIAWMWWCHAFGILVAWTGAAWWVAGRRASLAWSCGALVLLAPVVALTSFGAAPLLTFAGFAMTGALAIREAVTRAGVAAALALLAWSTAGFALAFYPPYQVTIGWIAVAVVAAAWLSRDGGRRAPPARWLAVGAAVAVGAGVTAAIVASIWDAIASMAATRYPGTRSVEGGAFPLWVSFSNQLAAPLRMERDSDAIALAGSLLFFPVLMAGEVLRAARRRGVVDPLACALLAVLVVLLLHTCLPLPTWLREATALALVPEGRTRVALGAADALLLVRVASRYGEVGATRAEAAAVASLWMIALAACGVALHERHASLAAGATAACIAASGAVAWALLRRWRPAVVLAAIVAASGALSLWWNPLVRGGSAYLVDNPISQEIRSLDGEASNRTCWVAYGPPALANVFRAIGVRALNGVHPLPQRELWQTLDPRLASPRVYDRFAHVLFAVDAGPVPRLVQFAPDGFEVRVAPNSPALACLGVTHVLLHTGDAAAPLDLLGAPGLRWLRSLHGHHFFHVERPVTAADCTAAGVRAPLVPVR